MKRLLFILTALLMASNVMAMRTVVFNPSVDKNESTGGNVTNGSYTLSKHGVTISVSSGSITNDYYRFSVNSEVTLSLDIDWGTLYEGENGMFYGRLDNIKFVCVASYGPENLDFSGHLPGGEYYYSGNVGTFSADGYNAREEYYFIANGEVRCTEIRVTVYAEEITPTYNYSEVLNVDGGNIQFSSAGNYPWITVNADGRSYAQSGNQGIASSTSELTATVNLSQSYTLSFDFRAWGEGSSTAWDRCVFSIDGVEQFRYGALDNDWETYMVEIPAGNHTLSWSYSKDSSVNPDGDFFAIDNVALRIPLDRALNVSGGNIHFTSDGLYPWITVEGRRIYAQSGNQGIANSTSELTAIVNVNELSSLSFEFMAWGEGSSTVWDMCIFSIDGVEQFRYGARDNSWETYTVDIPAGNHTLSWSYSKDGSVDPDGDFFAVDNVSITTKPVVRGDVDGDGNVTINDVTDLIDYLLKGDTSGIILANADCDQDGNVTINDVTTLIDYLLKGSWPPETFTVNGVTFKMIKVDGGTFMMGATAEQGSDAQSNETPAHQVTLSDYCIGETEVTQELWLAVMGTNPSSFTPAGGYNDNLQRPVERVSWNDCQTFISQLNALTGKNFRLPTEAEWEYAARGGNKSKGYKYAGSNVIDDVAWYEENAFDVGSTSLDYGTHSVATKSPNELGLYDMTGNVFEWVNDWYGNYDANAQVNPTGPATGSYRMNRGGSWNFNATYCRVAYRGYSMPSGASNALGLRLAL